ncbi:hypothetical protein [Variovorax sp. IB41]|uniref:hypothetical protein n=1 Tax=Variovorax sp. IB41 TaxID=2779370 RepID=UPI0018E874D1|nr:hypothetical protein [Variovorax sp. IB41]MBJ2158609.1 hypothetical protein [Variovorax sp. IB41]
MATSSILGGERAPIEPKGTDEDTLGPSDSSDSGSDAAGTGGNRAAAEAGLEEPTDSDILPDRVGVIPDAAHEVDTATEDPDASRVEDLAEDNDSSEDSEDGEPENA